MTLINIQFNMADIHPKITSTFLDSYNVFVDILWHDFESNLLSLLCDKQQSYITPFFAFLSL